LAVTSVACFTFLSSTTRAETEPSSERTPPSMAFEAGASVGFAFHSGRYPNLGAALPLTIDAGLRWPAAHVGAYFAYAPIFAGNCSGAVCPTEQSANLKRAGLLGRVVLGDGSIRPWIGGQLGMSWIQTRDTLPPRPPVGAVTYEGGDNGLDVGAWLGADAALSRSFALGGYLLFDYTAVFGDTGTPGIVFYSFGLRGAFDLAL
jgi:hypothetical protein